MIKLVLSFLLSFFIALPVYASATPSDADQATASDALNYDRMYNDLIAFTQIPLSSDVMYYNLDDTSDDTTISASFVPYAQVFDASGAWVANVRGTRSSKYDTTDYYCYQWSALESDYHYGAILYNIDKASKCLPTPGTYGLRWSFFNGEILHRFNDAHVFIRSTQNGVSDEDGSAKCDLDYDDYSFSGWCNVQIGYHTSIVQVVTELSAVNVLQILVPKKNAVMFTFSVNDGATVVAPDVSSGSGTTDGIVADTTIEISQTTASINDSLKEIITQISDQLAALWDQMYNYMHLSQIANDNANTTKITDSISSGASAITDSIEDSTTRIEDAVEAHGNFIIDGLKSLFIPSDEFFESYFEKLYDLFVSKLGFLTFPFELMFDIFDLFCEYDETHLEFTLPSISIMGYQLMPECTYDLFELEHSNEDMWSVFFMLRYVNATVLFCMFLNMCNEKLSEVLSR